MTSSTDDGRDANVGAFEQGLALAVQRGSRIERAIDETLFDQLGPRRFDVAASTQAYDNLLSSLGGGSGPEEFVLATINHDRSLELAMSGLAYQSGTGFVHDGVHLSIAMTALAEHEDVRIVLRVGDGRLANETRSLFKLGVVRDVHRIAAGLIAAQAVGSDATGVLAATPTPTSSTQTAGSSAPRSPRRPEPRTSKRPGRDELPGLPPSHRP